MKLPDNISDVEKLYRVIKRSKPEWLSENNTVSPALFKDPEGISVDRDGGRDESDIILFIEKSFDGRAKAIGRVDSKICLDLGAELIADPIDNNDYHALIFLDKNDEKRRNIQALQLADSCRLIHCFDNVDWIKLS